MSFSVVRYDHPLFLGGLAVLITLCSLLARLLTGNGPRSWKVEVAPGGDEFQLPFRIRKYWSRWSKKAAVPLYKLLPVAGREETRGHHLTFTRSSAGGFANMDYSERSRGGNDRGREKVETTERTLTWEVWDNLNEKAGTFKVRLQRPPGKASFSADRILLALALLAALGTSYALYHHVYLSF